MARLSDLPTIHERLIEAFGAPRWEPELDPLSELIVAVLSQHTAYPNSRRAFAALRERFPTWDAVRGADVQALEDAIRPAGLAKLKAPRLRAILDQVAEEHGALELAFLAGCALDEAQRWLERLPGVGPATAAGVLLFGLGRPAFPVDTGIHRVARRLGLAQAGASPKQVQAAFQAAARPEWVYSLHVNLIRHARRLCTPRDPRCGACPLNDLCDHFQAYQTD